MAKKRRKSSGPPFVQLYKYMLDAPSYRALSPVAKASLVELENAYNGANNGTIGMGVRRLADRVRCSRNTAARALVELEDAGFLETVRMGGFARHHRHASEYRLTTHRCDQTGNLPSKKFMQWIPPLSRQSDSTVPPESQSGQKSRPRSHQSDRQAQNGASHCPTGVTHLESYHGGTALNDVSATPDAAHTSDRAARDLPGTILVTDELRRSGERLGALLKGRRRR